MSLSHTHQTNPRHFRPSVHDQTTCGHRRRIGSESENNGLREPPRRLYEPINKYLSTNMSTPKYNKYNPGKTKGYFPINKWRCDTSKHPVITSSAKCASITPKAFLASKNLKCLSAYLIRCNVMNRMPYVLRSTRPPGAPRRHMKRHIDIHPTNHQTKAIRDDPWRVDGSYQKKSSWQQ